MAAWLVASLVMIAAVSASSQSPVLPAAVTPFPKGFSGTLVFQSDLAGPDNPQGRTRIYAQAPRLHNRFPMPIHRYRDLYRS